MGRVTILTALVLTIGSTGYCGGLPDEGGQIDQRALMNSVGMMYDIDPDLLAAIAIAESSGRSDAISSRGAIGLMQLMPATAQRFNVDLCDPIDNTLGAARFIDSLRVQQAAALDGGGLADLLAAYNAGEGAVERYRGVPPYDETREYVRRVMWLYLAGIMPPENVRSSSEYLHPTRLHRRRDPDADARSRLAQLRRDRAAASMHYTSPVTVQR